MQPLAFIPTSLNVWVIVLQTHNLLEYVQMMFSSRYYSAVRSSNSILVGVKVECILSIKFVPCESPR